MALATSVCPHASFIVQDNNNDALKIGREMVSSDKGLENRILYVEHNFFTPQKVVADVYIFRYCLNISLSSEWAD